MMLIREMNKNECLRVLAGSRLARLACAHENQPYVVPVYLAYDEASRCLYGFTTPGQKVEWMRTNPLVCVEVDEVTSYDQWVSVIAFGRYEEFPGNTGGKVDNLQAPERPPEAKPTLSADGGFHEQEVLRNEDEGCDDNRQHAWEVLKINPSWWQPGSAASMARAHRDPAELSGSVYYRVWIDKVTGHEATHDATDARTYTKSTPPNGRWDRVRRTLAHIFGGKSNGTGQNPE
jgi:nitroimidazol reductase NimA-like FMN-containing flavoprotein (pyridoxamine 5'-phosphate oxidase superfamily)